MDDILNILDLIKCKNDKINIFNIFIKLDNSVYKEKFEEIISKFKITYTFKDCNKILGDAFHEYKDIIQYIKTYTVLNNYNRNYIIFNDNLYKNLDPINICNKSDNVYYNQEKSLSFKIEKNFSYDKQLLNYLINEQNFINNFIKKRNSKSTILTNLWKKDVFNQTNFIDDITKLNYKNKFDTKIYTYTNKKYKIKKQRKIEFIIKQEKIITSVRLSLPNSFTICLSDSTYIHINKIIISETLTIGKHKFDTIGDKINFIFKIYEKFFHIKLNNIQILFNLSIKIDNLDHITYLNYIQELNINKINFTKKYIIIKYINTYQDLIDNYKIIEEYKKKYTKYFEKLNKIKNINWILYLSDKQINTFFN